jgi:hypothetical protein
MKFDSVHGGMPHPRPVVENPLISPSIPVQYRSSQTSWSHIGTPSLSVDQLFEHEANWDLGLQTQSAQMPLHFPPDGLFPGDALSLPPSSLSTIGDPRFKEDALESLALLPEESGKRRFCNIKAKPTLSSPGSIGAVESNVIATQRTRNVGRRRGPLDAKTREGANKVRKIRACASCRINKIRVRYSRYLD